MSNQYLVIHMTDSTGTAIPAEVDQRMLDSWVEEGEAKGMLKLGAPTAGRDEAKSVVVRDGEVLVTDGPFPEFKEWFAGYDLITAESIDDVAELMSKHPTAIAGRMYVLPLVKLPWDED